MCPSLICLCALCVWVCVLLQALVGVFLCVFTCSLLWILRTKTFNLSCFLPVHSVDKCHHQDSGGKNSAAGTAQLSRSAFSLAWTEVRGSGRGEPAGCWHHGARGPEHRQSCRLCSCAISSQSAAEGRCRSHTVVRCSSCEDRTHVHTLMYKHRRMLISEL